MAQLKLQSNNTQKYSEEKKVLLYLLPIQLKGVNLKQNPRLLTEEIVFTFINESESYIAGGWPPGVPPSIG